MKKIALSICLLAVVLFAFTGCGLLEENVIFQNECSSAITITVTFDNGQTSTLEIAAGGTETRTIQKGMGFRVTYPSRDANNHNVYGKKVNSDPITWKFANQVIY